MGGNLSLVVTGAPLASRYADLAGALVVNGWIVQVALTQAAQYWVDEKAVAGMSGITARSSHRSLANGSGESEPDIVVVCPATFNTIGKVATGIADTYVHSLLNETLGSTTPILMIPMVKHSLWKHPAWPGHLERLAGAGVWFLDPATGEEQAKPVASGTGSLVTASFDPMWVVESVRRHLRVDH